MAEPAGARLTARAASPGRVRRRPGLLRARERGRPPCGGRAGLGRARPARSPDAGSATLASRARALWTRSSRRSSTSSSRPRASRTRPSSSGTASRPASPLPTRPWEPENVDARGLVRGVDGGVVAFHNVHFNGVTLFDPAGAGGARLGRVPRADPLVRARLAPARRRCTLPLPGPGRHLLHAGAVGSPDAGVLVGGVSGSGKSTLTLACVEDGLGYGGDDYVVVTLDPEPTAHTLYTTREGASGGARATPGARGLRRPGGLDRGEGRPRLRGAAGPRRASARCGSARSSSRACAARGGASSGRSAPPRRCALLGPSTVIQMPHRERRASSRRPRGCSRDVPSLPPRARREPRRRRSRSCATSWSARDRAAP